MAKAYSFNQLFYEAWLILRKDPIVFAPMLLFSMLVTLAERLLPMPLKPLEKPFFIFMGLSTLVSLWFQLWTLAMVWQSSKDEDVNVAASFKLACRTFPSVFFLLLLLGVIMGGFGYAAALGWQSWPQVKWLMAFLGGVVVTLFVLYSEFLPVAVVVDGMNTRYSLLLVTRIFRWYAWPIFKYFVVLVGLLSLSALMAESVKVLVFLPPLIQGFTAAVILAFTYRFYLQLTRIDVVS